MRLRVNGRDTELDANATVAEVVAHVVPTERMAAVAVALNGEVVTRSAWDSTSLDEGDRVEVLGAIQGG